VHRVSKTKALQFADLQGFFACNQYIKAYLMCS
jgi:hypothetical protein